MFDRKNLMIQENSDGWIISPKHPLLELPLPEFFSGIKITRMGQWDSKTRVFERFLPGRLQAISVLLRPHNTELRFDGRKILNGTTAIGSFAAPPGSRLSGHHLIAPDFVQFLFEPSGLSSVLDDMSIDSGSFELRPDYIPADAALLTLSQQLASCFNTIPLLDTLYLDCLLQTCLNLLIKRHATGGYGRVLRGESLTPATTRRVIEFVDENISRPIRLPDLATAAGVSRAHFARAFRNVVGITPHVYVVQRRIERALQLLHSSPMKIADVAMATGFADHAHMTRTFYRYLRATPSAVRN